MIITIIIIIITDYYSNTDLKLMCRTFNCEIMYTKMQLMAKIKLQV